MTSNGKRVPEGYHTITPHLTVRGAAEAIAFYQKAFGAKEIHRSLGPGGSVMHAELQIGSSRLLLNDEYPEMGVRGPQSIGGTPVTLHLFVEDADALFNQAVQAGAKVAMPMADMFWGDRYGQVSDPYGHRWSIASRMHHLTPEQMRKAGEEAMAHMCK